MDEMWTVIIIFAIVASVTILILVSVKAIRKRKNTSRKGADEALDGEAVLKGIKAGISAQLHAAYPESQWRWICQPLDWVTNGGLARIEVKEPSGKKIIVDVCYRVDGYMALHVTNAAEMAAIEVAEQEMDMALTTNHVSNPVIEPNDEESVTKWYKIVLKGALTELIGELHANEEASLHIERDGKTYVGDENGRKLVHEFGNLPNRSLWGYIVDKLSESGLYAEIQGNDSIFISWC